MKPKYSIKITRKNEVSYMSFNGRTEWCYSQARKHLKDWIKVHGNIAKLEEN